MVFGPTPRACVSDSKASVPSTVSLLMSAVCLPWSFQLAEHKGQCVLEVKGGSWAGRSWSRRELGTVSAASPQLRGSAPGWRGFP